MKDWKDIADMSPEQLEQAAAHIEVPQGWSAGLQSRSDRPPVRRRSWKPDPPETYGRYGSPSPAPLRPLP